MYVFGEKTFVVPIKRKSSKEQMMLNSINTLLRKHIDDYRVEVNEGVLEIYVSRESYPMITRKYLRKLERICRKAGFAEVSVHVMS